MYLPGADITKGRALIHLQKACESVYLMERLPLVSHVLVKPRANHLMIPLLAFGVHEGADRAVIERVLTAGFPTE
jgi:hypothetical protein